MTSFIHRCHANGCEDPDIHPELPFCEKHFNLLPPVHRNRLWRWRPFGKCGICNAESATVEWYEMANLAIALICRVEYGSHGCPDDWRDDKGFCWGCGCQNVPSVYEAAEKIIKKFGFLAVD